MKSFFQRFHDSQPATSKSRPKDAAYKQWIPSSKQDKQRTQPSNSAEHPTKHHTTDTAGPRSSGDTNTNVHSHIATSYSTRYSTLPGSSANRQLPPNPSRSRTYPPDIPTNEQKSSPKNDAREKSGPSTGRKEIPELSGHDGRVAFRVKTERPSQPNPLSPLPANQENQLWLPEVQVNPKEKRRKKERQRQVDEIEGMESRPQQKPDSADGGHNQKEYRDHAAMKKESQQWQQQVTDMHQLRERETRRKERLKLRRESDDAEDKERESGKERLEPDRAKVRKGASEKGEVKEKTRVNDWTRGREDDRRIREEVHQRRKLQKEKEDREIQIQLEQKEMNEKRDREREAKEERDKERRAKDERERERRERKARERQAEREWLATREQTEKEYKEKFGRERQERQRPAERDQQGKRDREQAELERRELERLERERITQKQLHARKDQDLRQRETKLKEIDILRADRERQERRKRDRQLWEQQREREREERDRRGRGDQVGQIPEPKLSETGVDRASIRSKKRAREGMSDSEREQWPVHASDKLESRTSTQVNMLAETEDGRLAPKADLLRRFDRVDESGEPQPFSKSALRSDEYTLKRLQSQPQQPERGLSVPVTLVVAAPPSNQTIPPPVSSLASPDYDPSGLLVSHHDMTQIERPGSTVPIKSTSHPISYSVVRVPGPESSEQIPEVVVPQVAHRQTNSSSQDRFAAQPSRSTSGHQAQLPYSGPISSRLGLFTNAALEGPPQDIRIFPPEATSVSQTGHLLAPQGSPNSSQEASSTGRGVKSTPSVNATAATHPRAPAGNHEPSTQDNAITQSFQTARPVPMVDHVAPVPPIPNHLSTTSTSFLTVPNFHRPAKYPGTKDGTMHSSKESPEYGNLRQKDSVSQANSLQSVIPVPARPAAAKRQSNTVPGQYEPPPDSTPLGNSLKATYISRETSGQAHNKMQNEIRRNNTSTQPSAVPLTDELPLQVSTTLVESQYSGDKLAHRNNMHQRTAQEAVPATVTPSYKEYVHGQGHHTENRLTLSVPNDSRLVGHSRHQRYASENDVDRRVGKSSRYQFEGSSTSNSQQVQEPKQRTNRSLAEPNNKEGDEKVAFRLPIDAPTIGTESPDRILQQPAIEPQFTMGSKLPDQKQQGHHATTSSSAPQIESVASTALVGGTIVRPGTAVPRSSNTQPSDDTLPHVRVVAPPIGSSQSQSVSRPHIDRPGTALGIRQINEFRQENASQQTANEHTRSRTNSETRLMPVSSNSTETRHRMKVDVPPQQASYPLREVSSKTDSPTNVAEANNKLMLSKTGPMVETIRSIGVSYPEPMTQAHEGRPTSRSTTVSKAGGYGTAQQPSGTLQSYSEPVARKDDNRGVSVHPVQSRQRQQSSPNLQPEDNLSKVPVQKGSSTEDPRSAPYRNNQTKSTGRVEPVREDQSFLTMQGHPSNTNTSPPGQHISADDRGRGKHSTHGYSPNALQRTPPTLTDPTPTLPHYTGYSKAEEGAPSRSQKNNVHAKDARSAELASPTKANDVPGQSYLHDARRNLASKLEQQQLDGSPNAASTNLLNNAENEARLRTSSNRGEHSPKHAGSDSSPSASSKVSQSPDLRTRDYTYARTSPNAPQHNRSPRSKPVVVESQSQPGTHNRDEALSHATGAASVRQSLRERQDHIPEAEDKYSRVHYQTPNYAVDDTAMRPSDTNQKIYIPQNLIPYQTQDSRAGRTTSQRDGQRGDVRDVAQPIATAHSRSRSDSQVALDNSASYPRCANNAHPYADHQSQPHVRVSSDHVRPSVPTVETLQRPPDQSSQSHPHHLNQPQVPREEALALQQAVQIPTMKSIPSKRDTIEPSLQETHLHNSSSGPQPPTPKSYDIWLPPTSSREARTSHRSTVTRTSHKDSGRGQEHARRSTTTPRTHKLSESEIHHSAMDPRLAKPYHYLKTRKVHTMSLASVEAQDGAASTVIGSPTASVLSQVPINIPPEQDPMMAAREWTEARAVIPGQRVHKPGLVWADPEDPPLNYQVHRPRASLRRRTRSSGTRSREASDSDQPLPA